jgi:thiol:disulfide interchange protein DsbC
MRINLLSLLLSASVSAISCGVLAEETTNDNQAIINFLASKGVASDKVKISDFPVLQGFKQVVLNNSKVIYVNSDASMLIDGQVVNVAKSINYTQTAMQEAAAQVTFDPKTLKPSNTIKFVSGNSTRVLYLFTDPECPFCQEIEKLFFDAKTNDLTLKDTTLYVVPVALAIHPKASAIVSNIMCNKQPGALWNKAVMNDKIREPLGKLVNQSCKDVVVENGVIMDKAGISGTPSLFDANGHAIVDVASVFAR